MSEVKVNKLSPRSGTTVTIGDSGDTTNIVGTLQNNGAVLTGDISSVVAGTGLSGGGTSGDVTINIEAAQPTITSLGTITTFRSTGIDDNADALAMTINSSENVGIGETVPLGKLHVKSADSGASVNAGHDEIVAEGSGNSGITILSGTSSNGAVLFGDSGNNADGYLNYDHTNRKIDFGTAGATQWAIDSSGNFLPAATDHGIYLGVTSATASNLLNDYEEGTFTPSIESNMGYSSVGYGQQLGSYTKIGNFVFFKFRLNITSGSTNGNRIEIGGLPFTSASSPDVGSGANWSYAPAGIVASVTTNLPQLWITSNNTQIAFYNTNGGSFVGSDLSSATIDFYIRGTYQTA